jgi:hypothetical protein
MKLKIISYYINKKLLVLTKMANDHFKRMIDKWKDLDSKEEDRTHPLNIQQGNISSFDFIMNMSNKYGLSYEYI